MLLGFVAVAVVQVRDMGVAVAHRVVGVLVGVPDLGCQACVLVIVVAIVVAVSVRVDLRGVRVGVLVTVGQQQVQGPHHQHRGPHLNRKD